MELNPQPSLKGRARLPDLLPQAGAWKGKRVTSRWGNLANPSLTECWRLTLSVVSGGHQHPQRYMMGRVLHLRGLLPQNPLLQV